MKSPIRPIRVRGNGALLVRDAFSIQLVLVGTPRQCAPELARVLERYRAFVPPGALRWTKRGDAATARRFRPADAARAMDVDLWFASDEDPAKPRPTPPTNPAFLFRTSFDPRRPNQLVELRLPAALVWQAGVEAIVAFVAAVVAASPRCQSGVGGLQLACSPAESSLPERTTAHAIARLGAAHPGYLVCSAASLPIDELPSARLRAVAWLTILGPVLARAWAPVAKRAGANLVTVGAAGTATIARAGTSPSAGLDRTLCKVARALLPITQLDGSETTTFETVGDPHAGLLAGAAWAFRHLGGLAGAKRLLAARSDAASLVWRAEIAIAEGDARAARRIYARLDELDAPADAVNQVAHLLAQHADAVGDLLGAIAYYDHMINRGAGRAIVDERRELAILHATLTPAERTAARGPLSSTRSSRRSADRS